jgi:starvation-inducible DNA-binding protein
MEELIQSLIKLQSMVVKMYAQAHGYHWNVEGSNFPQYHEKLLEIYEDVYGSIDPISENIRKMGGKAPFGTKAWDINSELIINDNLNLDAKTMILELINTNTIVLAMLKRVCDQANQADEQGLVNFLADRLDKHKFWQWQLTATAK